jgi:transcriptional regulator with XRE-family HTH domain
MTLEEKLLNAPVAKDLFDNLTQEEKDYEKLMASISEKLITERKKRKLTQGDFANLLGVKQSMVSKWESGEYNFSLRIVNKIFSKLNMKVNMTFSENGFINNNKSDVQWNSEKCVIQDKMRYLKGYTPPNDTLSNPAA